MQEITYRTIIVRTPRDGDLAPIDSLEGFVGFRFSSAIASAGQPADAAADITRIFADEGILAETADSAIFRGRTNAVFPQGRDFYDVYGRCHKHVMQSRARFPALKSMKPEAAAHLVAAIVTYASSKFGVTSLPSQNLFGDRGMITREDEDIVLRMSSIERAIFESAMWKLASELPAPPSSAKSSAALAVSSFAKYLREIATYIVRKINVVSVDANQFRTALAYARWVTINGVPEAVNVTQLDELVELVNLGIDDTINPLEPSGVGMVLISQSLPAAIAALKEHPTLTFFQASEYPAHYKRYLFTVDRDIRFAPVVLTRNLPQSTPAGTSLVVHTHSPDYGIHKLITAIKGSTPIDSDISVVDETMLEEVVSLVAERRAFVGLISTVNGRELKALAFCLARAVVYTPPLGPDDNYTYYFKFLGPALTAQTIRVMDDSDLKENITTHLSVVIMYSSYSFGTRSFPTLEGVAEKLQASSSESIEVIGPKEWAPVRVDSSREEEVQGAYVELVDVDLGAPSDGEDPIIVRREEKRIYTGKLTLNAAMGITAVYPTAALRTTWSRLLETTRARVMYGIHATLEGDMDKFRQSGLHVYAFDDGGDPLESSTAAPDVLVNQWPSEGVKETVRESFHEAFRTQLLNAIRSESVRRGVASIVATSRRQGRDRVPVSYAEAEAYVETRLNVLIAIAKLLYGQEHIAHLLLRTVAKQPETVRWLTGRVLIAPRRSL